MTCLRKLLLVVTKEIDCFHVRQNFAYAVIRVFLDEQLFISFSSFTAFTIVFIYSTIQSMSKTSPRRTDSYLFLCHLSTNQIFLYSKQKETLSGPTRVQTVKNIIILLSFVTTILSLKMNTKNHPLFMLDIHKYPSKFSTIQQKGTC